MSRGLLRIASQRAPYLRAGLAWASREPLTVDIRDLDGERLRELVQDLVLDISIGQDDGSFRPLPVLDRLMSAEQLQLMIDSLATELPPVAETMTVVVTGGAEALGAIREAGYASLDALLSAHVALVTEFDRYAEQMKALDLASVPDLIEQFTFNRESNRVLTVKIDDLEDALRIAGSDVSSRDERIAELGRELSSAESNVASAATSIDDLNADLADAAKEIARLNSEIATLTAAAKPKAGKAGGKATETTPAS